ncbi:MAG: DUF6146 family protein [Weeksellaceae bacterium]|nr:DUF6146 family protein [Weeksellaceae bacterium]
MKNIVLISVSLLFLCSCATNIASSKESIDTLSFEKNEQDEYDIMVLDTGYDYFLKTMAKPENFHSEEFYKSRNGFYVNEWNIRHSQPQHYDPNFYSTYIDYNQSVAYGVHFEYKLYNFFKYIEWKYKIRF